ncbi:MAG TPA: Fe-S cluster assembly scaffold protein NifU [Spirochaetia bacterium]|nr:MAG: Fe-S cluster assembly scaffold protein NifU [Spirochaetes bacterium GWB1_36_13]HCL57741.1 Fe-S cluster assembly scaffold protein NifU [Spirochaetia bacterium]
MLYNKKVMDYFRNPENQGRIENADGIGKVGNPVCGDVMVIYLKIDDETIRDVKFETFGCVAAIATSSMAAEMLKGKKVEEALKITNQAVEESLEGLPPAKRHCSLLAEEGIQAAIHDYLKKKGG